MSADARTSERRSSLLVRRKAKREDGPSLLVRDVHSPLRAAPHHASGVPDHLAGRGNGLLARFVETGQLDALGV